MPKKLLPIDQIMSQLENTPAALRRLTECLSDAQLRWRPDEREWSIAEIIAHLRACADMWGDRRMLSMVTEDRPTIRTTSPITWLKTTDYCSLKVPASLHAFTSQRIRLLVVLGELTPDGWLRSAMITGAGKPFEVTIHVEGDAIARHERQHIKQIRRISGLTRTDS